MLVTKELRDCLSLLIEMLVNSHRRYFLPRVKIENYNIGIDGKIFLISQLMAQSSNTMTSE